MTMIRRAQSLPLIFAVPLLCLLLPGHVQARAEDWVTMEKPPIEELQQRIAADPGDFDALMMLGVGQLEVGAVKMATETLEAAAAIDPGSPAAHLFLGEAYNQQIIAYPLNARPGNRLPLSEPTPEEAERRQALSVLADQELETALELDPSDPFAWCLWGLALLRRSQNNALLLPVLDPKPVLAKFRKALEVDPGYWQATEALAGVLYGYGAFYLQLARHPKPPASAPKDPAALGESYLE